MYICGGRDGQCNVTLQHERWRVWVVVAESNDFTSIWGEAQNGELIGSGVR